MPAALKKAYEALFRKAELLVVSGECDSLRSAVADVLKAKFKTKRKTASAECAVCGKRFVKSASELESRKVRSLTGRLFCSRSCQVSAQNKTKARRK